MLAKLSSKNQLTLPKKIVVQLGFAQGDEKYVDIAISGNTVTMKPVVVTIEEKISETQLEAFHDWALHRETGDVAFSSAAQSAKFLKSRMKKK
jgi:bifunctional DNA-binding transcriptional regulator/antitoxin component of YhaV-PrlF toxin-antitoxin module